MVEIVDTMQEEIYQKLKGVLPPQAVEIIIRMHEEIRTLERAMNEQQRMMANMVEAMKLNQELYKRHKESLTRFEKKYSDPHRDVLTSENNDGS